MINVTNKVLKAWYELLAGNLSVPVYRVDAPNTEEGNYVLLRVESDSRRDNFHRDFSKPVIITEIVTKFPGAGMIDDSVTGDIDTEISMLLFPGVPNRHNLPAQSGIGIIDVNRANATYLPEDDGAFKYHRLVTRNLHLVEQLVLAGVFTSIFTNVFS